MKQFRGREGRKKGERGGNKIAIGKENIRERKRNSEIDRNNIKGGKEGKRRKRKGKAITDSSIRASVCGGGGEVSTS